MTDAHRPTSADVARRAGVSRATVSYVLNGVTGARIAASTRERVLAAAQELGYAPSLAGRALVSGRSDLVMLVMPDIPMGEPALRLVDALGRALARHGLTLTVHFDIPGGPPPARLASMLSVRAVVSMFPMGEAERQRLHAAGTEVVLTHGSDATEGPLGVQVLNERAGRAQAEHLAGRGHRHLLCAVPDEPRLEQWVQGRCAGVRAACADLGLPQPRTVVVAEDPQRAVRDLRTLRAAHPEVTGVCAYNDDVALTLLHGFRTCGVAVPGEVAVVGVDDLRAATVSAPPLTTVSITPEAEGERTAARVLAALTGTPPPPGPGPDAVRLVVREST